MISLTKDQQNKEAPINVSHFDQRVAVFVDVQNMYYSAKNLYSSFVDFGAILKSSLGRRKLIRSFAYVIKAETGSEKEFFISLGQRGFEVKSKDLQVYFGGAKKGDWDVGLCMDVVRMLPKIDVVVLVSGDGDYAELVEYAQSQGVRVEVYAFGKTTSAKLIETADYFYDLSNDSKKFLIKK
jgi:uncharacterized LabA/DUF88 family protein